MLILKTLCASIFCSLLKYGCSTLSATKNCTLTILSSIAPKIPGKNQLLTHRGVLVGMKTNFVTRKLDFEIERLLILYSWENCTFMLFLQPAAKQSLPYQPRFFYCSFAEPFIHKENDTFIVCGDFNFEEEDRNWKDYSSNDNSNRNVLDLFVENDIIESVYFKTAASWTLDIVLITENLDYSASGRNKDQINKLTNHFGVLSSAQFRSKLSYQHERWLRLFKSSNQERKRHLFFFGVMWAIWLINGINRLWKNSKLAFLEEPFNVVDYHHGSNSVFLTLSICWKMP